MTKEKRTETNIQAELWNTLTEDQQMICIGLASSFRQSGVDWLYLQMFASDESEIDVLGEMGILEKGTAKEFAQEWLDAHSEEIETINKKVSDRLSGSQLTEDERKFLIKIRDKQKIAEEEFDDNPRYRLTESMHDFAQNKIN